DNSAYFRKHLSTFFICGQWTFTILYRSSTARNRVLQFWLWRKAHVLRTSYVCVGGGCGWNRLGVERSGRDQRLLGGAGERFVDQPDRMDDQSGLSQQWATQSRGSVQRDRQRQHGCRLHHFAAKRHH